MYNNDFEKKLGSTDTKACEHSEKSLSGASNAAYKSNVILKTEKLAVRLASAALACLLALGGLTGCKSDGDDTDATSPTVTTPPLGADTSNKPESSYIDSTPVSRPLESEVQSSPKIETESIPNESTPGESSGVVNPPESSTIPVEPSTPKETETVPVESSKPAGSTTNRPVESSPVIGTETTPQAPSTPETTPIVPETSNPVESETEPPVIEDLPADADGYNYPDYFAEKIMTSVAQGALKNDKYFPYIKNEIPEIIFVERGKSSLDETNPVVIYAKYTIGPREDISIYARFSYTIKNANYRQLGEASNFKSYQDYIANIMAFMKIKSDLVYSEVSEITMSQDAVNAQIGENFAKFIDEKFVDAEINFVQEIVDKNGYADNIISGFAYDKDGKSYNFTLNIEAATLEYSEADEMILVIEGGRTSHVKKNSSTSKGIADVFTPQN